MRIERALSALIFCSLTTTASALNLQFKPSVHTEVQHDDNVFRTPDGGDGVVPKIADTLTAWGAGARLTLRESLQEIELRGEYDYTDYAELNELDYARYKVDAEARLAYASLLRLKLDAGRERRQENFAFRNDAENGLVTVDQASAELRASITPSWVAIAKAAHYESRFSRLASRDSNLTEDSGELGIQYSRNGYSSLGFAIRDVRGQYPQRNVTSGDGQEKDYNQQSALARISYTPSGLSDFSAQLAYTQRLHDDPGVDDFHGVTGRASYTRRFSGVSQLRFEAYRDLYYVEDINANYVENLGLVAAYDYRWSAKLAFAAAAERYESSYKGSPSFTVGGQAREDDVINLRIGADYQPFYRFSLLPEYRYERRGSNVARSAYDAHIFGVDLSYQYGLRTQR